MSSADWDAHERLYYYVDKRDLINVCSLLSEGANATKVTNFGRSAVGQAAFRGYSEILEALLKSCEQDYVSFSGTIAKKPRTELQETDSTPDGMDDLQWDDEISINSHSTEDEWSRLYKYYARMFEQTGEILANTIKLKDPHCLDSYHQAPIHYAAIMGHIECIRILLENSCPINITTQNGVTPLHLAITDLDTVKLLLRHKSDPNARTYNTGETVLHIAAKLSKPLVVELLIDAGADINAVDHSDRTPLMNAIINKNLEVALLFINRNAKLNVQDNEGHTAVYLAIVNNNVEIVRQLLEKGARIFFTHYLLHLCVQSNFLEMTKLLVEFGENVNMRDLKGRTPLYYAISECNGVMVDFLFKNGAIRFGQRDISCPELQIAVNSAETVEQFARVSRVLLAHGIPIDDRCPCCGKTPLSKAIRNERYQIAEFLIHEGANVSKVLDESIVGNRMIHRQPNNFNLLTLIANTDLKLYRRLCFLEIPRWKLFDKDFREWAESTYKSPFSLKKLCRIIIRNEITKNLQSNFADSTDIFNESRLKKLLQQTGLPVVLQEFVHKFDDLPAC